MILLVLFFSKCLQISKIALCSILAVIICLLEYFKISKKTRLFDSVAPEVSIISFKSALINSEIFSQNQLQ